MGEMQKCRRLDGRGLEIAEYLRLCRCLGAIARSMC